MNPLVVATLALAFLLFGLRPLLALLFGKSIGRAALERQPDQLTLVPADRSVSRSPERIEDAARLLEREGFEDAGWYSATEFAGLGLRLLAHRAQGWLAVLYDHPQAGRWCELVAVMPDRSRFSFVSRPATGLSATPGFTVHHYAGASVELLLRKARAAKLPDTPLPVSAEGAAESFARGFAEVMAARKAQGVSRTDVVRVALKGGGRRAA